MMQVLPQPDVAQGSPPGPPIGFRQEPVHTRALVWRHLQARVEQAHLPPERLRQL